MKIYKIKDLGRVVTGRTPPNKASNAFGSDYPFITPSDMDGRKTISKTERYISNEYVPAMSSLMVPAGSVAVSCIGWQMGKSIIVGRPSFTNQQINSIILYEKKVDANFLYYSLLTRRAELQNLASSGTRTPIINKSRFEQVDIPLPDIDVQIRIASILSAYDDLIENNSRRIKILEEMARSLYREWFVHFRFPGHEKVSLVESQIGNIPEGWPIQRIEESFQILGGGTPSKEKYEYWIGGNIAWYTPSDLTASGSMFMDHSSLCITAQGLIKSSARLFPAFSVMMTSRATIGAISINTTQACTNQGFITCVPNENFSFTFIYYWLESNVDKFIGLASGATFKEITKGTFKNILICQPPGSLASDFSHRTQPMVNQILTLQRKNQNLRQTRDLLLPKLISGEIDVSSLPDPS